MKNSLRETKAEPVINAAIQDRKVSQTEQLCSRCVKALFDAGGVMTERVVGNDDDDDFLEYALLRKNQSYVDWLRGCSPADARDLSPLARYCDTPEPDKSISGLYRTNVGIIARRDGVAYTYWYEHLDSGLEASDIYELIAAVRLKNEKGNLSKDTDAIPSMEIPVYSESSSEPEYSYSPPVSVELPISKKSVLVRNGWWGAVGIEPNPGPGTKHAQGNQKKGREVVRVVHKQKASNGSFGKRAGSKFGGFVGDLAQKAIMGITGMGDYTVTSNSLFQGAVKSSGPPQFLTKQGSAGMTRIVHREYIGDVSSVGLNFNLTRLPITPTSSTTFPWLSQVAQCYEKFKFHGLVFEFSTASATAVASTNTALGKVILCTQYNSVEPPFTTKLQMDQYEYAVSTVPCESAIHPVECKPSQGAPEFLYLSEAGNFSGDQRWNQIGAFSIATVGQQAPSNIGELWVSYDVELVCTRLPGNVLTNGIGARWSRWSASVATALASYAFTDPWSAVGPSQEYVGNAINICRPGPNGLITFAPGFTGAIEINVIHNPVSGVATTVTPVAFALIASSINVNGLPIYRNGGGAATSTQVIPANGAEKWYTHSTRMAVNIGPTVGGVASTLTIQQLSAPGYSLNFVNFTISPISYN